MDGRIFNIQNGALVEMREQAFDTEDVFQELLQRYPSLLAGDEINRQSPRRWLLIRREMGIASEDGGGGRWSLDHLFIDQEGIPTLVEVKRSSDTRIRREVVGQMLDYAANAVVHWSVDRVQAEFSSSCEREGVEPSTRLEEFLAGECEPEEFWQKVKTNLQASKIRMLFVADIIPAELKRIIEFLNEQMDPAEVLGVEIRHYVGEGLKTLVPRVIGQTAEAQTRKSATSSSTQKPNLTLEALRGVARDCGVGDEFDKLVQELSLCFAKTETSGSHVIFKHQFEGNKNPVAVISLFPDRSSADRGVYYSIYVDRLAMLMSIERDLLDGILTPFERVVQNSEKWGGECRDGYTRLTPRFEEIVRRLPLRSQA